MKQRVDDIYNKIGIYGIRNKVNNKIYIGKTSVNFGDRWDTHKSKLRNNKHNNRHLQYAWNKYGSDNFEFVIIEECEISEINNAEIYWIKYYKDLDMSYNILPGGEGGMLGGHLSDEAKKKISEKNKINSLGKKHSEETKEKMRNSHLGKKYKKMSNVGVENLRASHTSERCSKKLTTEDVINIRNEYAEGNTTYTKLGEKYGVTCQCISDIIHYKRWKNV